MYNRYIPQSDGSYRRSRVPEPNRRPPQQPQHPPKQEFPPCEQEMPRKPEPQPMPPPPRPCPRQSSQPEIRSGSVGSFLKQLLPKDFETADLFIVLLLLLMAGDNPEEQSNALLTLALYLFM